MESFRFYLIVLFIVQVSSNQQEKLTTSVKQIITNTVTNNYYYCVISILQQCEISSHVAAALIELKVPTFQTTIQNVKSFSNKVPNCEAYIIALKYLNQLKRLFITASLTNETFTHNKRFLVFYESRRKLYNYESFSDAYLNGTEVIIVQQHYTTLQVTFTWKHDTVNVLNDTKHFNVIPEHYKVSPWKPKLKNKFRVSTFHCPPFVLYDEERGAYGGPEYNVIREITKDWPVEYTFHGSNSWARIIEDVAERKSDFAMCSLWQAPTAKSAGVSYPFAQICVTFLVPKPQLLSDVSYVFQPFQLTLWILIIAVVVLVSNVLHLLLVVEKRAKKSQATAIYKADVVSALLDAIRLFTLGSLSRAPSSTQYSLRHVLISFSMTCLILSTAYSAGFTSSLTYPRYSNPIRTVQDMIDQNVKIEVDQSEGNIKEVFTEFTDSNVRRLSNFIVFVSENKTHYDGMNYAKLVKVAGPSFVTDTEMLDSYSKTHLQLLKGCIAQVNIVFAMQRDSVFAEFINKHTARFIEHGFLRYWFKEAVYRLNFDYIDNFYSVYVNSFGHGALKTQRLKGVFIMLAFGCATSTLVFIIELIYYKKVTGRPLFIY